MDGSDPLPTDQIKAVREVVTEVIRETDTTAPPELIVVNKIDAADPVVLTQLRGLLPARCSCPPEPGRASMSSVRDWARSFDDRKSRSTCSCPTREATSSHVSTPTADPRHHPRGGRHAHASAGPRIARLGTGRVRGARLDDASLPGSGWRCRGRSCSLVVARRSGGGAEQRFRVLLPNARFEPVCTPTDPALAELSGLAVLDGKTYGIGDSGTDDAVVVLDGNCAVTGTVPVPVDPYDIEDWGVGPDGRCGLADTGDNLRARSTVALIALDSASGTGSCTGSRIPTPPRCGGAVDAAGRRR